MRLPKELTILTDDREKAAIPFPDFLLFKDNRGYEGCITIKKARSRLKIADYCYANYDPLWTVFEKKGSVSELATNTGRKDSTRFIKALNKLSEVRFPYMVLTFPITDCLQHQYVQDPQRVMDMIYRACHRRKIAVWWAPVKGVAQGIALGTQMLHVMFNHCWETLHERSAGGTGEPAAAAGSKERP